MGKREIRIQELLHLVRQHNGIGIRPLAEMLGVSEMTVRRDLESLTASGTVHVIQGVVLAAKQQDNAQYHLVQQQSVRSSEKGRIAKEAAKMVQPGDSIFLDIGTTTCNILRYLPSGMPITVICCTVNTLLEALRKNFGQLIFCGGFYHGDTQMFESIENNQLLSRVRANKAFISAAGVSASLGLTCANEYEVHTKTACISTAQQKILLVDSQKLGQVRPAYFAALSDMDRIITDTGASTEWQTTFESLHLPHTIV